MQKTILCALKQVQKTLFNNDNNISNNNNNSNTPIIVQESISRASTQDYYLKDNEFENNCATHMIDSY